MKANTEAFCLLIVDDEEAGRYGMRRALSGFNYWIAEAESVDAARRAASVRRPDLLLLDVNLPGESGLEYLRELSEQGDAPLVIVITAHGSERIAVDAIKGGAHDYLSKPFDVNELRISVKNALETLHLRRENERLRQRITAEAEHSGRLRGISEGMRRVRGMIEKVAETDATVLIRGESGTGKELVARELHERSARRRQGACIAINCAALPADLIESELFGHEKGAFTGAVTRRQGKFEQAQGGTLFLDEIGDMSLNVQAKLLRALEERRIERLGSTGESIAVDVRIVSATHRPLEQEIAAGRFRADLFYRLRVVTIEVPPLRERREDVPLLAESFAVAAAAAYNLPVRQLTPAALSQLIEYNWPGNVRELRNVIERAAVMAEGDELTPRDLPNEITITTESADVTEPADVTGLADKAFFAMEEDSNSLAVPFTADFRNDRREFERRYIARCLEESNGNVTRAAAILGMHRQSLQHKLRELGLTRRYISVAAPDKSDT